MESGGGFRGRVGAEGLAPMGLRECVLSFNLPAKAWLRGGVGESLGGGDDAV